MRASENKSLLDNSSLAIACAAIFYICLTICANFQANKPKTQVNSIQLIQVEKDWYVTSMVWCNQNERFRIPDQYLA